MTTKDWLENKKKFAVVGAILFWIISVVFSVYGFSFDNETGWAWLIGLAMSLGITIIQLVGNSVSKQDNVFTYIWWLSYVYGIGANVYGILNFMGADVSIWYKWVIAVPMGVMIEVVPEKLLLISMDGLKDSINDLGLFKAKPSPVKKAPAKYVPKHRPSYQMPTPPSTSKPTGLYGGYSAYNDKPKVKFIGDED